MITLTKINDFKVKPLKIIGNAHKQLVRAPEIFPDTFFNCAVVGWRKAGKTHLIANIMNKKVDKNTHIIIFCNTVYSDPVWKQIVNHFEEKGNLVETYRDIVDPETGENYIKAIIDELEEKDKQELEDKRKDEEGEDKQVGGTKMDFGEEKEKPKRPRRKPKYEELPMLIVFDDASSDIRDKYVMKLCRIARHVKISIILAFHYICNIQPDTYKNIDYLILFRGQDDKAIENIRNKLDLSTTPLPTLLAMYKKAIKISHDFFLIDKLRQIYRWNFNIRFNWAKN